MNLPLFQQLFKGRADVYGADNSCIRQPLTEQILAGHLNGKRRIGVYPLLIDKCNFIVVDIDINDLEQAKAYFQQVVLWELPCYIEASKRKGFHCWHFFESPVIAKKARAVINHIFQKINHNYETFPKQSFTQDVGNYINLPLFNDGKDKRTVFLDPLNSWNPYENQWGFLASIEKISPSKIDTFIIELNIQIEKPLPARTQNEQRELSSTDVDLMTRDFINRAVAKASSEGRNNAGLDLASQLRDHGMSEMEAKDAVLRYQSLVSNMKDEAYTEHECLASLKSAYRQAKRESWWKPLNRQREQKPKKVDDVVEPDPVKTIDHDEPPINEANPFPKVENKLCNEYINIMTDVTEAPASYHFFTFMTVAGMLVNRNAYVQWGSDRIYPNLWTMIVGQTGRARKSSTINKGRDILYRTAPDLQVLSSLATWEGLLLAMSRKDEEPNLQSEKTLVCMSEFDGFLKKSRNDAISHLIPELCNIYDCPPEVKNSTKGSPIVVKNPFLSILAGIQPEVLEKSFQTGDVNGGFAGRFIYVYDVSDKEIPIPIWNKQTEYNQLITTLSYIKNNCIEKEIIRYKGFESLWNPFYHTYRTPNGDPSLLLQLNDRMQNHVLKMAMIFAVLDGESEIMEYHLADAINIGYWLIGNNRRLFGMLGASDQQKIEQKIIDLIANGTNNRREIFQSMNITGNVFDLAISGLMKADVIYEVIKRNPKGRPSKLLFLSS
jgi:hypothetical protein